MTQKMQLSDNASQEFVFFELKESQQEEEKKEEEVARLPFPSPIVDV